ncbi:hypothetical protein MPTK1_3g25330 [Marchantia polymorpha subsp. ruderalis]|uniref:Uncharacterized protein n=3 Tax=Marchantia polymorpha TaxID=3197 RepID=A0AAF6B4M8_MARPO|nr:hypothetical protein MARPO_0100s0046 [Marchantia polymorpha]BBN06962.1 hypothetical protein Mp_3g25330 [Marchantia polymorpha subsp. ruderalis]|eukprot:PTQ32340.1 hypothetical protein MARPO_0100s0046 [Marchantia polymorpha]
MAMRRWVGWAREVVRLMRGLPDEDLQRRNLAMHEQLIRLRKHRLAQEELREKSALNDIRKIVEEMKALEANLVEAEKATAEYVESLAEQAKAQMESDLNAEADIIIEKVIKQTSIPGAQDFSKSLKSEGSCGSASTTGATEGKSVP